MTNKKDWYLFCFGSESAKSSSSLEALSGHKPLLNILYEMDQATIVQLLDYQVEWAEEYGYSKEAVEINSF